MSFSIGKESVKGFQSGVVAVGTSAVQLSVNSTLEARKGVLLRPLDDTIMQTSDTYNGFIFVGSSASVSGDPIGEPENFGMPLGPGETFVVPVDSLNELWIVASKSGQLLAWAIV